MSLDKEIRDCLLNYDADVETCKLLLTRARDEIRLLRLIMSEGSHTIKGQEYMRELEGK